MKGQQVFRFVKRGEPAMGEEKNRDISKKLESEELEQVTGGAAWRDDPEAIDNVRRKEDPSAGGIGTDPSVKAGPQTGAGILDRMALGMDRVKEGLTSMATDT